MSVIDPMIHTNLHMGVLNIHLSAPLMYDITIRSMYVCMYVYIYIYMYVCMYVCVCVCLDL